MEYLLCQLCQLIPFEINSHNYLHETGSGYLHTLSSDRGVLDTT